MFAIVEKIDKALENREKCMLVEKSGRHFYGILTDSWVRVSGGKMRGKVRFQTEEKGEIEVDVNDILDLRPGAPATK